MWLIFIAIILITGFLSRIKQEGRSCSQVDLVLEKPFTSEGFSKALENLETLLAKRLTEISAGKAVAV